MLSLPASVKVYLCVQPTDMRKGFDSLAAIVREEFGDDPLCGHLFLFRGTRFDRLKILWWDRDGFVVWYKRLERGTFRVSIDRMTNCRGRVELPHRELAMLLEGLAEEKVKKLPRFAGASS